MGIVFSKGSGVNESIYGKSQEPIRLFLEKRVESFEKASHLKHIFFTDKDNSFAAKFTSMTSMGGFSPVGEGGAYPLDEQQEGYSKVLEHDTWKDSFSITQEMIEDSKIYNLKKKPAAFVGGYNRTRELFGAALFGGAVSGKNEVTFRGRKYSTTGADGKPLFSPEHPSITNAKSKQANCYADAFTNDALIKAECKMQDFRDDNGNVLAITPDTIIIPNEATIKRDVFAAIGADKDPATANNGFNYTFGRWTVIVWQYLNQFLDLSSGSVPWILQDSKYNDECGGAVWLDRIPLTVKSWVDENTDNNIWKGRARFTAGFNDWRAFLACGVSGGESL